jgi:4-hydroxy-4-methyl-2-oxoglutarate aldolase
MRRIVLFMANYQPNDREGLMRAAAFLDVLQKLGWTGGRNIAIEYRWAAGDAERGESWGGTATFAASRKGIAGLVTNGTVRDLAEILERKFPVFATGTSLVAGLRGHPGWLDIPIGIGEVVVHPGDFIVGDLDGVVVVSLAQCEEVAKRALEQRDREVEREKMLLRGATLMDVLKSG